MKKIITIILAASIAAVSCSKMEPAPFWKATVKLVPSAETKTSIDETAHLMWSAGDRISFWTSADGVSFGVSTSAEVVDGAFTATIPTGHSYMKVVYPAVADGAEYAIPTVKKYQNHSTAGSFDGHYLPMIAEKDDVVEGAESIVVSYTVLGSILKFKVTGSGSLKAIKAGEYQADFLNTAALSSSPVDAYVVVPLGSVTYTPKAFVIATDASYREYTRLTPKESTFSAKAYEIAMTLNDNTKYSYSNGWRKASDIGLSVAWADMNYGSTNPYTYSAMDWRDSFDWGSGWRLPTYAEMEELTSLDASYKRMETLNGINGCSVTNNGASIFLPVGGKLNAYYGSWQNTNEGFYWNDKYNGTRKRNGDPYPLHACMRFSSATDFSSTQEGFDEDSRAIRLVRPLD